MDYKIIYKDELKEAIKDTRILIAKIINKLEEEFVKDPLLDAKVLIDENDYVSLNNELEKQEVKQDAKYLLGYSALKGHHESFMTIWNKCEMSLEDIEAPSVLASYCSNADTLKHLLKQGISESSLNMALCHTISDDNKFVFNNLLKNHKFSQEALISGFEFGVNAKQIYYAVEVYKEMSAETKSYLEKKQFSNPAFNYNRYNVQDVQRNIEHEESLKKSVVQEEKKAVKIRV